MDSRVNEKLYYAQLVLAQAARAEGAARRALVESALFHLVTAYRGFLQEIAAGHKQRLQGLDARQALRQLQQEGWSLPGLAELAALEQGGQWPAQLLAAYAAAVDAAPAAPVSAAANDIALVQMDGGADVESCGRWLQSLQASIDKQRELLQEW